MTRLSKQEPAVLLGLPLPEPEPPADCEECQDLARQRAAAKDAGDLSRVSDCNVWMRNHHRVPRRQG